jgi:hypothetical protein
MALSERLIDGPRRPPPKTCTVCWLQSWIGDDDVDALAAMLADRGRYTAVIIADALRDEYGIHINHEAVGRHRIRHMDEA